MGDTSRREANNRRFVDLEDNHASLQNQVNALKRKFEAFKKPLEWVVEGSSALEAAYKAEVESPEGGGWFKLKSRLGEVLGTEIREHLQLDAAVNVEAEEITRREGLKLPVAELQEALSKSGVVANVHCQYRRQDDQVVRLPDRFVIFLKLSTGSLKAEEKLTDHIEAALRTASGLHSWGVPPPEAALAPVIGGQRKRLLMYPERTAHERQSRKGKGKGKGKVNAPAAAAQEPAQEPAAGADQPDAVNVGKGLPTKGKGRAKGAKGGKGGKGKGKGKGK